MQLPDFSFAFSHVHRGSTVEAAKGCSSISRISEPGSPRSGSSPLRERAGAASADGD